MNDRFKFRTWDKQYKKFRNGLAFQDSRVCTYDDNVCVLEQCTGLRDINGNLIYEGDIVCIVEYGDYDFEKAIKRKQNIEKIKNLKVLPYKEPAFINKNHAQIIVWDNKRATFMMKERINSTGRPESLRNKRYVVIGNIHENAELMQ